MWSYSIWIYISRIYFLFFCHLQLAGGQCGSSGARCSPEKAVDVKHWEICSSNIHISLCTVHFLFWESGHYFTVFFYRVAFVLWCCWFSSLTWHSQTPVSAGTTAWGGGGHKLKQQANKQKQTNKKQTNKQANKTLTEKQTNKQMQKTDKNTNVNQRGRG